LTFTNPQFVALEAHVEQRGVLDPHFAPSRVERKRRDAQFVLAMLSPLSPGRRVLDFGCGAGVFVAEALRAGWDAVGVDLNRRLAEAGNDRWDINSLHGGPLEEFCARGMPAFDAVVAYQVFERITRPLEIGAQLVRLIRPGGVLYVDVPHARQPREWLRPGATLDPTAHVNHFTYRSLRGFFERLGCTVIFSSAAPALLGLWRRAGLGVRAARLGAVAKRLLPPVGSGLTMVGRVSG
jgi:SAM-dependent methyltransferase